MSVVLIGCVAFFLLLSLTMIIVAAVQYFTRNATTREPERPEGPPRP